MRKNAHLGMQKQKRKSPVPEGTRFFADNAFKRSKKNRQWRDRFKTKRYV